MIKKFRFTTLPRAAAIALAVGAALFAPRTAFAQFAPGPNPITGTVGAQTLTGGTGTINGGGAISVASGSTVPLLMSGTSTLVNNGTIQTLGTGRAIDSNTAGANLNVTNNGLISSVSADAFRVNTNSIVSLSNFGTIQVTAGGQAIDWAAITSASNTLTNQATGIITTVGEDAVRPGTGGIVNNAGTISAMPTGTTSPSGSDGVDLRTFTGIQVTNTGAISGRHGIATDGANVGPSALTVNNNTGGTITALNGSGLNVDGVNATVTANVTNQLGATIKGGVLAAATDADGDGIDIDGVLTLNNSGNILGLGAKGGTGLGNNAEGIAAGGGSITNNATGQIIGSTLAADAPNGDPTRAGNGILIDDSNGGNAVAATTINNSGLIQGKSGFGVRIIGNFADGVTNNAGGTIRGAGTTYALQTGGGGDTVTNRGAIIGDGGNAIDLEAGDDALIIEGNSASIVGNVSGGSGTNTLTFQLGAGNAFNYGNSLSSFSLVETISGRATLSGVNTYAGVTRLTGGSLTLDGANRLATTSSLQLNGGTLELTGFNGPNAQTFASLSLTENSTIDLNSITSLTFDSLGTVTSGKSLSVLEYNTAASPDYAIRFLGNLTNDPVFLALLSHATVNGTAPSYRFDGVFTNVQATPEPASIVLWTLFSLILFVGGYGRMNRRRG